MNELIPINYSGEEPKLYQQEIYTQDLRLQIDFRDGSKECLHMVLLKETILQA